MFEKQFTENYRVFLKSFCIENAFNVLTSPQCTWIPYRRKGRPKHYQLNISFYFTVNELLHLHSMIVIGGGFCSAVSRKLYTRPKTTYVKNTISFRGKSKANTVGMSVKKAFFRFIFQRVCITTEKHHVKCGRKPDWDKK